MGRTLERWGLKPVRLFASDLDGTVLGDAGAVARFREAWEGLSPDTRPLLVYNSGRLLDDLAQMLPTSGLPVADCLIGGVGTMLKAQLRAEFEGDFPGILGPPLDHERIAALFAEVPGLERQPDRFQHAFKSSWYLRDASPAAVQGLEARLNRMGLSVQLVYSSQRDLDLLPRDVDKGAALRWLCNRLKIGLDEVVVAGDTGNDVAMFRLSGVRGIVVANALPELHALAVSADLIFQARQSRANGVIEGLVHWNVLPMPSDIEQDDDYRLEANRRTR